MRTRRGVGIAGACLLAIATVVTALPAQANVRGQVAELDVAPRVQWNANDGYCGETSLIMAGMAFGQYTSQWTARALASPGVPQTDPSSQLLLGENDLRAARAMHLEAVRAPMTRSFPRFTAWIGDQMADDHVVILGMLNNTTQLGEEPPGDLQYDHIVPVMRSSADRITISDNGLLTVGRRTPMSFTYRLDDIRRSRAAANAPDGPTYSLTERGPWFGLSVTGPRDAQGVLWPVRLAARPNGEGRQDQAAMAAAPKPRPIRITATVSPPAGADGGVLYMYDSFAAVPDRDLNAHADAASARWDIPAGSGPFTVVVDAMSDSTRVFRAVSASAP